MSFRNGGEIVVDGLILALDASSPRSYPGSGTTWYDLSGNSSLDGTMVNGVIHESGSIKSMQFDGTSDHISFPSQSVLYPSSITACAWVKLDTIQRDAGATFNNVYRNGSYGSEIQERGDGYWRWWINIGGTWAETRYTGSLITTGSWGFVCGTYDQYSGDQILYLDGVNRASINRGVASIYYLTPALKIGSNDIANARFIDGNIGCFYMYNRALSATEVLQNYNATKGRFL